MLLFITWSSWIQLLLCKLLCLLANIIVSKPKIYSKYMKSDKKQFLIYLLFGTLLKSATTKAGLRSLSSMWQTKIWIMFSVMWSRCFWSSIWEHCCNKYKHYNESEQLENHCRSCCFWLHEKKTFLRMISFYFHKLLKSLNWSLTVRNCFCQITEWK